MASSRGSPGPHDRHDYSAPRARCVKVTARTGKPCRHYRTTGSKLCKLHRDLLLAAEAGLTRSKTPPGKYIGGLGRAGVTVKAVKEAQRRRKAEDHAVRSQRLGRSRSQRLSLPLEQRASALPKVIDLLAEAETNPADSILSLLAKADSASRTSSILGPSNPSNFVVTEQARDALRRLGLPTESDPSSPHRFDPKQVLLDTVHSAWRQRQIWEEMLHAIPPEDWSQVGIPPIPGVERTSKGARIEVISKYLGEATKVAARTSKLAIDAGIEERLVKLAEEQSALIADTVRAGVIAAIGSLHLSPLAEAAAISTALGSAANHLRALAAGGNSIIEGIGQRLDTGP